MFNFLKRKTVYLLIAFLFISILLSGCGNKQNTETTNNPQQQTSQTQKKFKIGFSNGFSGNSWRAEMLASLQQEAQKYPNVDLIVVDGQGDINKQVNDIESLIAQKVDAIMLIPNSAQAVQPVLKKAISKGIKVVDFNLPLDDQNSYTTYIGTDMKEKGKRWAEWLRDKLNGQGNIVMLGGIPGNPATAQCIEGAKEVFQGTNIKILAYRDANWQEDKAKVVMADLLAAYPQIDGIWSDGGQDTCGAIKAMLDANRPLVPACGDDYNGLFKLYMNYHDKYPKFDIGIISEPTYQSKIALQTAVKLLEGQNVEKWVKVNPPLLTGKDASQYVKKDLPDTVFVDTDLPESVLAGLNK